LIFLFHDSQNTDAYRVLNNNYEPFKISNRFGQAKPSATIDIYGHLYPESQELAAMTMDEVITPIPVQLTQRSQAQKSTRPQ
jgi:hypothetical protein